MFVSDVCVREERQKWGAGGGRDEGRTGGGVVVRDEWEEGKGEVVGEQ